MYLLDTNIISELRRPKPHGAVLAWLQNIAAKDLYIAAITIGELQSGVELTRERDPEKAAQIEAWLERIVRTQQIISLDGPIFRKWAQLMHRRSNDHIEDALIAATALVRSLIVVTRNIRDFKPLGVQTLNPFTAKM